MARPHAGLLFPQASTQLFSWPGRSQCDRIATIKCQFGYRGAIHEFGTSGAVEVLGLVKSARVVVVSVDVRERHQYRGLVVAVPLPAGTADRRSWHHVQRPADAPSLRG